MLKFQPSFSFWPRPQFLGESHDGFAAWIVDRDASLDNQRDAVRGSAIQKIIENHHDKHVQTIEPSRLADADV